jgi:putative transposase
MLLVEKHIVNQNSEFYSECDSLCFKSKNLYNAANYIVRQEFIQTSKNKEAGLIDHANYINYYGINRNLIDQKQFDMYELPIKVSNQTLMMLDKNWKAFFRSIKDYIKNPSKYKGKPNLPKYLNKTKGRFLTTYELGAISKTELKKGFVKLSKTNIKIPFINKDQTLKIVRIVPAGSHYTIEIVYEKQCKELKEDNGRYCSIDLGLNNLATVTSNVIKPIIINGRPLKSINQYYNKKKAHYQSKLEKETKNKTSNRVKKLTTKRNNKIEDYLHKSSRYIINHLVSNNINTLVIGKNEQWKQEINIGGVNNQNFVQIPHAKLIDKLVYKAALEGIRVIITEESYTSKASFINSDPIPNYGDENIPEFSGYRKHRGLYKLKGSDISINSDVNGGLNILRKAVPTVKYEGIEVIAVSPILISL